nr:SpoIIE family protein phosphatase [Actibacterium mucosum]
MVSPISTKTLKTHAEPAIESPQKHTVLLVDDSRVQRRIVRALLARWGYEVIEAATGAEALDICATHPVDIIISDWMMPGMNGLEFCSRFRKLDREGYGYFILLTSKSETEEMVHGLEVGADDFLTKPVNAAELKARLTSGERVLKMESQLNEKNQIITDALTELQGLYDAIDRDLLQARKIQESLVPRNTLSVGRNTVSLFIKPCGHVGGDLVGAFDPNYNRLAFYNIDVSGHGITSALMTARLAGYLSGEFLDHNLAVEKRFEDFYALHKPAHVAESLNQRLLGDNGVGEYFTMAYAIVDLTTGHLSVTQAGHTHPVIQRADGRVEFVGDGGMPVGLLPDVEFENFEVQLQPGDRILFYSDGFTESVCTDGEMLEQEGLEKMLNRAAKLRGHEMLDDLFWMLTEQRGAEPLEDDVSAVLFEYEGV